MMSPGAMRRIRMGRGGFVLPLVLLVMVAGTATLAVMLSRQSAQALAVRRHLDHYQEHHGVKGLAEVINAWLTTLPGEPPLHELVRENPRVLELELAGGSVAAMSLRDGQHTVLRSFGDVDSNGAVDGPGILDELEQLVSGEALNRRTREAGPVAISVRSADPVVLRAAMRYVAGDENRDVASDLVYEIRRQREDEERMTSADLAAVANRVNLEEDQRELFNRVLAAAPTHFRLRVELRAPAGPAGGGGLLSVYEGGVSVRSSGAGSTRGRITSFEPVRIE